MDSFDRRDWEAEESGSLIAGSGRRDMEAEQHGIVIFTRVYTLAQIIGVVLVALVGVWIGLYRGGFSWRSHPAQQFNWHPFFMVLGFLFLYANGMLIYRGFRSEKKKKLKIIHAVIHVLVFIFIVIGLQAVFDSHNLHTDENGLLSPVPNMYSVHSWIGMTVVLLFVCQWLFGFVTFLVPGLRPSLRSTYLPVHQFFGMSIFVGAAATCLMGLTEKAFFSLPGTYSHFVSEGVLINCIGLVIILFAGLVIFLTSKLHYKRRTTEDEILLADTALE